MVIPGWGTSSPGRGRNGLFIVAEEDAKRIVITVGGGPATGHSGEDAILR